MTRVAGQRSLPIRRIEPDELIDDCSRKFHVTTDSLASASKNRRLSEARAWLSLQAVEGRIASVAAVARRLGRTEAAIRRLLARRVAAAT